MKKYNLSEIMKRAWELVKKAAATISAALRQAWKEAKEMVEKTKFEDSARLARIEKGEANPYIGTEYDCDSNYLSFRLWKKAGMKRIYINDYKNRSLGYIDVITGQVISDNRAARETATYFIEHYSF